MENLTVVIHSHNSPDMVNCLESALKLSHQIVVIGEENRQPILDFFRKYQILLVKKEKPAIVESLRNYGIAQVRTDWVFLLDADERISPELVEEIKKTLTGNFQYSHFQIPRKEIVFRTKWLQHGGWWPNHQTRLINKKFFKDWPDKIHATPVIDGEKGKLRSALLHYSQDTFEEIVEKTITFEDRESELLYQADRKVSSAIFFRKFLGELWRRLIKWQGFLDGNLGIMESIYQAFSKTITYIYLYEKKYHLNLEKDGRPL